MTALVLRAVEVEGEVVDVRIDDGRVTAIGPDATRPTGSADGPDIDGRGGALLPGLWDHHVHLLAMAAALHSVRLGPPVVHDADGLASALRRADRDLPRGAWLRGVGYHDSVAGPLDRHRLDLLVADRPTRVQHRSGARWSLNSAALRALGLEDSAHPGVERDGDGRATGRLVGADDLVRRRLGALDHGTGRTGGEPPDLAEVGRRLARAGVTGVTDATPADGPDYFDVLAGAVRDGDLPVRVMVTGSPSIDPAALPPELGRGPAKVILADHALPSLAEIVHGVDQARRHGRAIALHCVTLESLVLGLAAFDEAGAIDGDRIEHGAVIPPDLAARVAALGLTVVTQPNFVAERGDEYRADVEPRDLAHLYPCASLIEAGVRVAGSTDAPFGDADPWRAVAAAVHRRTPSGAVLGDHERLAPDRALALFLGHGSSPGGPARRVAVGAGADVCLLDAPLAEIMAHVLTRVPADPGARHTDHVVATICAGVVTHRRDR